MLHSRTPDSAQSARRDCSAMDEEKAGAGIGMPCFVRRTINKFKHVNRREQERSDRTAHNNKNDNERER